MDSPFMVESSALVRAFWSVSSSDVRRIPMLHRGPLGLPFSCAVSAAARLPTVDLNFQSGTGSIQLWGFRGALCFERNSFRCCMSDTGSCP